MKSSFVASALAAVAAVLAALACLSFPLTSNPGPESAQVLAVAGGVALCLSQAVRGAGRSTRGFFSEAGVGLVLAVAMVVLFIAVTAIGGAARPSCSPSRGFLPFLFLALPVLVLQTATGTWVGWLLGKPGRAVAAAALLEVLLAVWLFISWYRAPSFRVASHAFVVVTGDLLRGAAMPPTVVGFRTATLLFGVTLLCLGAARHPPARRSGLTSAGGGSPIVYAGAASALVAGLVAHVLTIDVIMPPRSEMLERYSLVKKRGLLVVHADPLAVRPKDVDALLAEGTLWLDRISTRLGHTPNQPIDVFVHASREAEEHWTGASHVDFTLPWRHEIHVVGTEVPHHSLGHELAHAVAGELTTTWLRIPSDFVIFEHAAIIEGLAVALTPELAVSDGLTVKEQAAAMKRAGFAPDTAELFRGLSFFEEAPARAYVAAGAFIESLVAKSMPDPTLALATLYRTGSLEKAAGGKDGAAALVAQHDKMLDELPLPPDAASVAHALFEKPSILRDVCKPENRDRARDIRALARTGFLDKALAELPPDAERKTLEDLFGDLRDVEDHEGLLEVGKRLDALPDALDAAGRTDELGDALWLDGHLRDGLAAWDRAKVEELPVDEQRTLVAKRMFAEAIVQTADHAPVARAALDLLLSHTEAERAAAFARLHYWLGADDAAAAAEPRPVVSLGRYIHARRLEQTGALDDAVRDFRRVLADEDIPAAFLEQSELFLGTALVKNGAAAEASQIFAAAADAATRPAMRLELRDFAERADRAANAPEPPKLVTSKTDPAWADRLLLGADAGVAP